MIQSEVFPAKLTINRIIENGVCEKTAILEVGDRFGNRTEYDITDSDSIQEMLSHYDEDAPMTIDEAIAQAEEAAAKLQEAADGWKKRLENISPEDEAVVNEFCEKRYSEFQRDAADHRQLASWLRELKKIKESQDGKVESVSLIEEDGSIRQLPLDRVFITRVKEEK